MMYNELDWEDIESRLYSQVYHASAENELTAPTSSNTNDAINLQGRSNVGSVTIKSTKQNNRYFHKEKDIYRNSPVYISIEQNSNVPDNNTNPVQSNVCFESSVGESSSSGNFAGQVQNNITVNQYSIPVIINSEVHKREAVSKERLLSVISYNSYQRFLEKKHRRRIKRQEKREKKRKNITEQKFRNLMVDLNEMRNNENIANNDVICVSDESTGECEIVPDTESSELTVTETVATGFPKKYDGDNEQSKKPESDDDIIYIPPPPVEVINIDVDEGREKEQDRNSAVEEEPEINERECVVVEEAESPQPIEVHETSEPTNLSKPSSNKALNHNESKESVNTLESSVSNDFLEQATIENTTSKFNFGLHGSDFNSAPGDFVRPTTPMEFCETESSCSTNDLNREYYNSVKTIVFDEVEFPRVDIFSENNLASFGSYITPRRDSSTQTGIRVSENITPKKIDICTSSDSSSESDIEPSCDRLKCVKEKKKLPNLSPMQFNETPVTNKKSKKKNASEFFKETKKDLRKRKSDVIDVSESDSDRSMEKPADTKKKQPKKKYKTADIEETPLSGKKKKASPDTPSTSGECDKKKKHKNPDSNATDKTQNKKKKDLPETIDSASEESVDEINLQTRQKKKKKPAVETKNSDNEKKKKKHASENVDQRTNVKEATTKKKKKKNSESAQISEPEFINDAPVVEKVKKKKSISENEETVEKKSKKRRKSCSTSSNKSLDVGEVEEYIEVELLDDVNVEAVEFNAINNLEVELCKLPEQNDLNTKDNVIIEEKTSSDNVECTIQHSNTEAYTETFATITGISNVVELDENDSDEEIIVDDDQVSNVSSLIVVDEVNSTTVDEQAIEVLLSSDSENVPKANIEENLELANCSYKATEVNISEEIIVVEDNCEAVQNMTRYCGEFDMEAIHRSQTDDPEAWKISHKDRMIHLNDRSRGPRCSKCRQYGHIAVRCIDRRGPPKCSLCGSVGHQEPRCTKKMCLQCGNEGDYSTSYCWKCFRFRSAICRICSMRGHLAKTCPDLWRRYHLTTEAGPIVLSQEPQLKPKDAQWCSGCAKRGHLEHECNYYNRAYPPSNPCIMSYDDVFEDETRMLPPENIPTSQDYPTASYEAKSIPPLMSLHIPVQTLLTVPSDGGTQIVPPVMQLGVHVQPILDHRVVAQSGANHTGQLLSKANQAVNPSPAFVNPCAKNQSSQNPVLDKMKVTYLNEVHNAAQNGLLIDPQKVKEGTQELCRTDQRRIKHVIMSMNCHKVREFLKREMADLHDVATQSDPKYLRKMFFKYDGLSKSKKPLRYEYLREQCFWNRILNIFIFGVHKFRDGALHFNYLQSYLSEPKRSKLDIHKRRSLFSSYSYIFGVHRHPNISYRRLMNQIMVRCNSGQDRRKQFS